MIQKTVIFAIGEMTEHFLVFWQVIFRFYKRIRIIFFLLEAKNFCLQNLYKGNLYTGYGQIIRDEQFHLCVRSLRCPKLTCSKHLCQCDMAIVKVDFGHTAFLQNFGPPTPSPLRNADPINPWVHFMHVLCMVFASFDRIKFCIISLFLQRFDSLWVW